MDKQEFMKMMLALSLGLRKWAPDFSDQATLQVWYSALKDIHPEKLKDVCRTAMTKLDEFPSIATFLRLAKGNLLSDKEIAVDIAGRIEESITRYGYNNPDLAQTFIGEIGWEVVRQMGGWVHICESLTYEMLPSSRKQWRELAEVVSKKFHLFGENRAPALPQGSTVVKDTIAALLPAFGSNKISQSETN